MNFNKVVFGLVLVSLLAGCASSPSHGPVTSAAKAAPSAPITPELQAQYQLALTAIDRNDLATARTQLLNITALRQDLAGPWYNLGWLEQHAGDNDKAEAYYQRAIDAVPGHAAASNNLGNLLRRAGKFTESNEVFEAALSLHPDNAELNYNAAILYELYLHDLSKAIRHYERYQAVKADDTEVATRIQDLERRGG